ncbi:MAG: guanylate kinase [Planctomycetota bacterium]|jgi:guanylate kinase|nr:guanylate kinase [Planctomycetota bacterium]
MSSERGRLIVVSGPTASGKSTLWRRLIKRDGVDFSVSATTRDPRRGEVDGQDYHFVSDQKFQEWVKQGAFLEWAEVHGKCYGTLREHVLCSIDSGNDIVLEIDVQGTRQLVDCDLPLVTLFVTPPSREVLEQRLRDRGTETEEQIQRRLSIVEQEMSFASDYQYQVVNDDFDRMEAEVELILGYRKEAC